MYTKIFLDALLSEWKKYGFPLAVSWEHASVYFNEIQHRLFDEIVALAEETEAAALQFQQQTSDNPIGSIWWEAQKQLRGKMQEALVEGLVVVDCLRVDLFRFGVLPEPATDWRFYRVLPGYNILACWDCDSMTSLYMCGRLFCPVCIKQAA